MPTHALSWIPCELLWVCVGDGTQHKSSLHCTINCGGPNLGMYILEASERIYVCVFPSSFGGLWLHCGALVPAFNCISKAAPFGFSLPLTDIFYDLDLSLLLYTIKLFIFVTIEYI